MGFRDVSLLVVCTGNAARSVMVGVMLRHVAAHRDLSLSVATAGTHAVDGLPLGARTLAALRTVAELDTGAPDVSHAAGHRSRQLGAADLAGADLVVAMEAAHVRYVRARHPGASPVTATLRRLARDLPPGPAPLGGRVAAMGLADVVLGPDEDVADPAGQDDEMYARCAAELWLLTNQLVDRL